MFAEAEQCFGDGFADAAASLESGECEMVRRREGS